MKWTRASLANPAAVAVIVAIILLLGVTTLFRLPLKLLPDIENPMITVQTFWRAASPQEIESEITDPLEEVLQGTPGMETMGSWSNPGVAWINLEFSLETKMDEALIDVISRINRLPPMPADSDPPQVILGGGGGNSDETLIYLFLQVLPGNTQSVDDYARYVEDSVLPRFEAVRGVSNARLEAGSDGGDQLQIIFDPFRAAQLGIDLTQMAQSIGRPTDTSGGFVDVGRRKYNIRFPGRYTPEELGEKILTWRDGVPIRLGDVAQIKVGPGPRTAVVYQNGNPAIGMRIGKESRANVLATLDQVTAIIDEMNAGELQERGLAIHKSFDPSVFIRRAINLLSGNLVIGSLLAVGALWWFLRQGRATAIIAFTIPVSLLATLVSLWLAGRSLNIISLAGLAFATGMVLDAAIVVLENIVRLREKGMKGQEASETGSAQVWGALLASTATTIAIFLPIMFLKDVEGQLFADLALTIAIGVGVSLLAAVTVLPVAANQFLKKLPPADVHSARWDRLAALLLRATETRKKQIAWIAALMTVPVLASIVMMPSLNYLPPVKRDAVDAFVMLPAGANIETIDREVAQVMVQRLEPYMTGEKEPALKNYYFMTWPGGVGGNLGVRAADQGKVDEIQALMQNEILAGFPDVFAFAQQGNLFGDFGNEGSIALHILAKDPDVLRDVGLLGQSLINEALPGARVQAQPDPGQSSPEIRLIPNDERIAEMGWSRDDIARVVRSLGDGLWLGEYFHDERRMDIIMKADKWNRPESLSSIPLSTPNQSVVPLGDVVRIERGVGPGVIQRIDRRRSLTLNINQPDGMALEDALEILKADVEPQLRAALPEDGAIVYAGSANDLARAVSSLGTNFLMALGLLFLIMAALFRSPRDAFMVIISIPLATVGGIAALRVLNLFTFAPLDLLTMIGFIILLGLVVNNAILLVVETRRAESDGASRRDAVHQALRLRMRPIFMSTATSIMGMLPLVLFPGEGSAIYRGMATTIVGGMCVSTLFTLVLLPSLLQVGEALRMPKFGASRSLPAE